MTFTTTEGTAVCYEIKEKADIYYCAYGLGVEFGNVDEKRKYRKFHWMQSEARPNSFWHRNVDIQSNEITIFKK